MAEALRRIPKVDRVLAAPEVAALEERYPRERVVEAVREEIDALRERLLAGAEVEAEEADGDLTGAVAAGAARRLEATFSAYYRRVVNATGVVLHTGLGRAPLAPSVAAELGRVSHRSQRVEVDLESGERGGRDAGCARLLERLTGCEAATVVNNNAGATLLILAALARGKEVVLSRGELVEIGGSYRVPDVMRESGAVLVEVGTTNRTHERDYREALTDETGMILKVHTSNYRIEGFTKEVELPELVELGREHGVPVVHDLGSGCLADLAAAGVPGETLVADSVAAGADVVCFSGDKLLGGPQAGILVGRAEAVARCRRHPLFRALRPGRLVYTALEATLRLYLAGEATARAELPALARLLASSGELRGRAEALAAAIRGGEGGDAGGEGDADEADAAPGSLAEVAVVPCASQAGSGSLPARDYPSWGVRVVPREGSAAALARRLRLADPSIFARIQDDALLFDLRTVADDEVEEIAGELRRVVAG